MSNRRQTFTDTRFGNTATLSVEPEKAMPYVLRVRDYYGHLHFMSHYVSAHEAKLALERIQDPCCFLRCNWYTVSGCVEDVK